MDSTLTLPRVVCLGCKGTENQNRPWFENWEKKKSRIFISGSINQPITVELRQVNKMEMMEV